MLQSISYNTVTCSEFIHSRFQCLTASFLCASCCLPLRECHVIAMRSPTARFLAVFRSYRHLGLSIKHDSRDNALIDKRATKQFAFCHSWFALRRVINYLQRWSCYMQHHVIPSARCISHVAGRINCHAV